MSRFISEKIGTSEFLCGFKNFGLFFLFRSPFVPATKYEIRKTNSARFAELHGYRKSADFFLVPPDILAKNSGKKAMSQIFSIRLLALLLHSYFIYTSST